MLCDISLCRRPGQQILLQLFQTPVQQHLKWRVMTTAACPFPVAQSHANLCCQQSPLKNSKSASCGVAVSNLAAGSHQSNSIRLKKYQGIINSV